MNFYQDDPIFQSLLKELPFEYGEEHRKLAEKVMEVFIEEGWGSFKEEMRTVRYFSGIVLNQEAVEAQPAEY